MINAALVLEGGSLRSLYTAGVLDTFLEHKIEFSCVIAVSAGALTAANYISSQKMRTAKINILHSGNPNYYGLKQLILKRSAFNLDYVFDKPINELYPYDEKKFEQSSQNFFVATTDCNLGKVKYFNANQKYNEMIEYLRASSSLPLLSPMVHIDGGIYLDGGIVAPIGIEKAFQEKYDKIVVVSTREINYIKHPKSLAIRTMFEIRYKKYPYLLEALHKMPDTYNNLRIKIDKLRISNKIFVIQPKNMLKIRTVEKDARKLAQLYFQGINDAEMELEAMFSYLRK